MHIYVYVLAQDCGKRAMVKKFLLGQHLEIPIQGRGLLGAEGHVHPPFQVMEGGRDLAAVGGAAGAIFIGADHFPPEEIVGFVLVDYALDLYIFI